MTAQHLQILSLAATTLLLIGCQRFSMAEDEPDIQVLSRHKPEDCSRKSKVTDMLTLHYTGTLQDGQLFDSSHQRKEPFKFQLGIGQVILGWEKALNGVCAGEKIRVVVPPNLAYGDIAHDKIPAKSTLTFDIEVLKVEDGPKPVNVFKEIDTDGDERLSRPEIAAYLKKQLHEMHPDGDHASHDDPEHMKMVDEVFAHEDSDKDGYITHDEFSGPKYDHEEL